MNNTDKPESAFPSTFKSLHPDEAQVHRWGMTLRDYFAAKALWGVVNENHMTQKQMAKWSYEMADEMLKAREA
jgi:hypothetical protein